MGSEMCIRDRPITDIYIKPDWGRIDELNRRVIDFVLYERLNK